MCQHNAQSFPPRYLDHQGLNHQLFQSKQKFECHTTTSESISDQNSSICIHIKKKKKKSNTQIHTTFHNLVYKQGRGIRAWIKTQNRKEMQCLLTMRTHSNRSLTCYQLTISKTPMTRSGYFLLEEKAVCVCTYHTAYSQSVKQHWSRVRRCPQVLYFYSSFTTFQR